MPIKKLELLLSKKPLDLHTNKTASLSVMPPLSGHINSSRKIIFQIATDVTSLENLEVEVIIDSLARVSNMQPAGQIQSLEG